MGSFRKPFDFNGDGKEDWIEMGIAYKMYQKFMERQEDSSTDGLDFDDDSQKYAWRDRCNDGIEYNLDPEDYETEKEYEEAIAEAKEEWFDSVGDGTEQGILPEDYDTEDEYREALEEIMDSDEEDTLTVPITLNFSIEIESDETEETEEIKESDYPNMRTYNAAYELASEYYTYSDEAEKKRKKGVCHFILENPDILASRYLSSFEEGFLYTQAVKEHFQLPISVPDEDEYVETYFKDLMKKVAYEDSELAIQIWVWCLDKFLPYAEYDREAEKNLTVNVLNNLYDMPDSFLKALINYMAENTAFRQTVIRNAPSVSDESYRLIYQALTANQFQIAKDIFEDVMFNKSASGSIFVELAQDVYDKCSNWKELESMEAFLQYILPSLRRYESQAVIEACDKMEKEAKEYIENVERSCKKNTSSPPQGVGKSHSEADWKIAEEKARELALTDKNIYRYCGVMYETSLQVYHYRTDNENLKIGDMVFVPVGHQNKKTAAQIVSVEQHSRLTVPYPIEKSKFIIGKCEEETGEEI